MSELPQDRICQGCTKSFKTKQNYERHTNICKELAIQTASSNVKAQYEKEIHKLRKEIEKCKELLSKHGIIQDTTSYKQKVNHAFSKLPMFSTENVINNINLIHFQDIQNINFIVPFVNAIKIFVFCTDTSRGKLVVKQEGNIYEKINVYSFIMQCFTKAHSQLNSLLDNAIQYNTTNQELNLLKKNISQLVINKLVKDIAKHLISSCERVIKN